MMEIEEIERLVRYHQDGLNQYRLQMNLSAQGLEERTIIALEELKQLKGGKDVQG